MTGNGLRTFDPMRRFAPRYEHLTKATTRSDIQVDSSIHPLGSLGYPQNYALQSIHDLDDVAFKNLARGTTRPGPNDNKSAVYAALEGEPKQECVQFYSNCI